MEHRTHRRIPVKLKLLLYKDGLPVAVGRTRDVSKAGLFVQTDYTDFGPQQSLEVELLSSHWARVGAQRHWAFIAHNAQDGIGLRFDSKHAEDYMAAAGAVERTALRTGKIDGVTHKFLKL